MHTRPVVLTRARADDLHAIFTGSTTIVEGKPAIIYPGICDKSHEGCVSGTALAAAVPKNASDPLYQEWTKAPPGGSPADNPLVNDTQRDPSTAWRTQDGEWRLTTFTGKIYHSWDFIHWSSPPNASDGTVMDKPLFPQGECPVRYFD